MTVTPSQTPMPPEWRFAEVKSPHLPEPVRVIAAQDIPYVANANRLQNISIYLPETPETADLVGGQVSTLPGWDTQSPLPRYLVHLHGGAWRDPHLTAASIEPAVAHAFSTPSDRSSVKAVTAINYTVSPYPQGSITEPYDPIRENHTDLAREAVHPQHISDVLRGLDHLRSLGLSDEAYILSGHSCGACLALQTTLQPPSHYGLDYLPEAPRPAAVLGVNGLYDLPALVDALPPSHAQHRDDYEALLSNAFGPDRRRWPMASPALIDPADIARGIAAGRVPRLIVVDQSPEDQLVPMSQKQTLQTNLGNIAGLRVEDGHRLSGTHAEAWEGGIMLWNSVREVLALLQGAR